MLKAILIDTATGKALEVLNDIFGDPSLGIIDHYQTNTRFKSNTRVAIGTSTIASPTIDGAIMLTDIIISTDKVALSQLIVFFDDGTRTIPIYHTYPVDAPTNVAISLHGAWTGWANASLKMTTVAALTATVAVGYIKVPRGLEYTQWDALR